MAMAMAASTSDEEARIECLEVKSRLLDPITLTRPTTHKPNYKKFTIHPSP